jgi:hypothetical protein
MSSANPYILLGVDYGSPVGEAKRAFSRAARQLKSGAARKEFARADLSWALNEIEHELQDPEVNVAYLRIPANPDLYRVEGFGLLHPAPYLQPRTTPRPERAPAKSLVELPTPYDLIGEALLDASAAAELPDPYPMLEERANAS